MIETSVKKELTGKYTVNIIFSNNIWRLQAANYFRKKATQVHACSIFNTKGISIKVLQSSESFLPVLFEFLQKTKTFTAFSDPNIIFKNVENVSRTVKIMWGVFRFHFVVKTLQGIKTFSESCQTSKMECFAKIVKSR